MANSDRVKEFMEQLTEVTRRTGVVIYAESTLDNRPILRLRDISMDNYMGTVEFNPYEGNYD